MVISDLNYLETISNSSNLTGSLGLCEIKSLLGHLLSSLPHCALLEDLISHSNTSGYVSLYRSTISLTNGEVVTSSSYTRQAL